MRKVDDRFIEVVLAGGLRARIRHKAIIAVSEGPSVDIMQIYTSQIDRPFHARENYEAFIQRYMHEGKE